MTSVIFVFTRQEAIWAAEYYKNHPQEKTVVIAPNYTTQKILADNCIPADEYYQTGFFENYFTSRLQRLIDKEKRFLKLMIAHFAGVKISNTELLRILTVVLEQDFLYIIFAFEYLKSLERKWKPNKYYISKKEKFTYIGASATTFVIAALAKEYFIDKEKIYLYSTSKGVAKIYLDKRLTRKIIGLKKSVYYKLLNLPYLVKRKLFVNDSSKSILLFSAGMNLDYYSQVLNKPILQNKTQIITSIQSQKDEWSLNKHKINFIPLSWFRQRQLNELKRSTQKKMQSKIYKISKSRQKPKIEGFTEKLNQALFESTRIITSRYLEKSIQQTLLANKVISIFDPKLVITTHDPGPSAVPFVYEAKALGKKTLVLCHGYCYTNFSMNHYSDNIIVYSKSIKNFYINKMNTAKNSIYTCGFPYADYLFTGKIIATQRININKIGFLLTKYLYDSSLDYLFFKQIFSIARELDLKYDFLIRTHPGYGIDDINDVGNDYGFKVANNPMISLEEFVLKCDILVSANTTAMFWPMAYSKPLFYTTPLWQNDFPLVEKLHAAWIPKNARDMFLTIQEIQHNRQKILELNTGQKRFLKEVLGYIDGSAADRTAQMISKILGD